MKKLSSFMALISACCFLLYQDISTAQIVTLSIQKDNKTWSIGTQCVLANSYQCQNTFPCPGNGTILDTGTGNPANDVCLAAIFDPPASWQSFTWVMDSSCAAYGWTAENPADNAWVPSFAISVRNIPWNNNYTTAITLNLSSVTDSQGATTLTVKCSATNLNPK